MPEKEAKEAKQRIRLTLQEYSERLKEIEAVRNKISDGGVETEDVILLCERTRQYLLNSQIVVLDRTLPSLDVYPAECPKCSRHIWVMTAGRGIAWHCSECGTASSRNYRMPKITGDAVAKDEGSSIVEGILLALQRKKS